MCAPSFLCALVSQAVCEGTLLVLLPHDSVTHTCSWFWSHDRL